MSDKKMYTVFGILIVFIVVLLVVLSNIYLNKHTKIPKDMQVMIENSAWPTKEVPFLYSPHLQMSKFGDELQMQEIPKGVSFEEFKEYLLDLKDAGFVADTFFGCQDPSLISPHIDVDNITEFTWMGYKGEFYITAIWKKEGTNERISNMYVELSRIDAADSSVE